MLKLLCQRLNLWPISQAKPLIGAAILFLIVIWGSVPVAYADEPIASGTYTTTVVTQYSSDFEVSVQNLTNGNYFSLYRNGTIIGSVTPISGKVRSIPQMFSDPDILEVRFYINANGTGRVATAALSSPNLLIIDPFIDNCFIATAAFGSKFEPAVMVLRQFRDRYLLSNPMGQAFVNFYYANSPPIAEVIADSGFLKAIVRILLIPLILLAYLSLHPIWIIFLIALGVLRKLLIMGSKKNPDKWAIPLILFVLIIFAHISISNAATINDIGNNSLRIGYDLYSLDSDHLTDENIMDSLNDLTQVYFKIGGLWYDVLAAQSDAELGDPVNALNSETVTNWTGLGTWFKAGNEVTPLISIPDLPAAPSDLTAIPADSDQVDLNWTAVTGAISYHVYRSSVPESLYALIATCSTTAYHDSGLTPSTDYWYKVSAVNNVGEGSPSSAVKATTLANVDTYLNNAQLYYDNAQYDEAIAECNKAIQLDTTNVEILMIRGLSYFQLDSYANALADFDAIIQLDSEHSEAYLYKGRCHLNDEQYSDAVNAFSSSIQLAPTLADGYKGRGISYAFLGQAQAALDDFSMFIQYAPNDADAYFLRAAAYFALDNYQESIDDCDQAIFLDPQNAYAYNNRGAAYHMLKDRQEAVADYLVAIQLKPDYVQAFNNLGVVYHGLEQYEDAIEAYNQAISLDPNYVLPYSNRARSYDYLGQDDLALSSWAQALALDPELAGAYEGRGWYYYYADQEELAVADFTQAIQLFAGTVEDDSFNPWASVHYEISSGEIGAFEGRGWSYYYLDQINSAISDFSECISIDPKYADAYNARGFMYYKSGQYNKAIEDYTEYIELDSTNDDVFAGRGWSYYHLENYVNAIADFNTCISLNSENINGYHGRGSSYYFTDQYSKAAADFTKCISLDPTNDFYYDMRGLCYCALGEYNLAATDFTKCISLVPNDVYYYDWRGWCYYQLGKYGLAISDFTKCISLDPTNDYYYDWRGWCYYQLDQYNSAVSDFTQCINLDPTNDYYYSMRGWCYLLWGRYSQAESDFWQSLALNPNNEDAQAGLAALGYSFLSDGNRTMQAADSTGISYPMLGPAEDNKVRNFTDSFALEDLKKKEASHIDEIYTGKSKSKTGKTLTPLDLSFEKVN